MFLSLTIPDGRTMIREFFLAICPRPARPRRAMLKNSNRGGPLKTTDGFLYSKRRMRIMHHGILRFKKRLAFAVGVTMTEPATSAPVPLGAKQAMKLKRTAPERAIIGALEQRLRKWH
jgi:hypothetical protein